MKPSYHPRTVAVSASQPRRSAAPPLVLLLVALALPACRGPRVLSGEALPPTPAPASTADPADPGSLLHAANATPRAVSSFSAACRLKLVTPEGETVHLDGVIAAQEPGSLRLQAWKFDRPAIDFTVTPAGRFLFVRGQEDGDAPPAGFAAIPPGGLPSLAPLLTELPEAGYTAAPGPTLTWPARAFGVDTEATITATLDAANRVEALHVGRAGERLQRIAFANFRSLGGVAWPMDWELTGRINGTILLEDVELNPDLPAAAFEPPADAQPF